MTQGERFHSIDIVKGIMVLLLYFVNALYMPGILPVFSDSASKVYSIELSEWAVTGFIFMFGMTVPFVITKKINNGLSSYEIIRSIISKFLILITIGVLMVNTHRVNTELTGFNSFIWSAIMFSALFLVWVRYPDEENNFFTVTGLRLLGMALLVFLIFRFRSGTFENSGSLIPGWWEVPGLMGWGYLVAAFVYLALRNSILGTSLIAIIFLLVDIFTKLGLTDFMVPVRPFIGVVTDGCIPFIILSGQLSSLILKKYSDRESSKTVTGIALLGSLSILTGIILLKTLPEFHGYFNPAVTLIINGICIFLFLFFHWVTDIKKDARGIGFFRQAGENYLTTYLFQFIIYNLILLSGVHLFFFRQSASPLINIVGSGILAVLMMVLSSIIIKMNIKLKI